MPQETKMLSRLDVDLIFKRAKHQNDYVIGLHKRAVSLFDIAWDEIKFLDGDVKIAKGGDRYIFEKAIDFDKEHHPGIVAGDAWKNSGFSSGHELDNAADIMWEVTIPDITYQ